MKRSFFFLWLIVFPVCSLFGQQERNTDYRSIRKVYELKRKNDSTVLPDVERFIRLAKKNRDDVQLVQAYKDAVLFSPSEWVKLKYADSTVVAALRTKDNELITSAYLGKGIIYYFNFRKYRLALNEYLKADKYANKVNDQYLKYKVIYHIGVVKSFLGYYDEAAAHFRHCSKYYREKSLKESHPAQVYNNKKGYYNSLHQLTVCCRYQKLYSKTDSLVSLGLQLTANNPDFELEYAYFLKCRGISGYHRHQNMESIRDLESVVPAFQRAGDFAWLSVVYSFLTKNYLKLEDEERAIHYAQKVDSIFIRHQFILPELRNNYEFLIRHFKIEGDVGKQLYYTNQLLEADSLITKDFSYLSGKLHREYDTRNLREEKHKLEKSNSVRKVSLIIISILLGVLSILLILYYRRERHITKKYRCLQEKLTAEFDKKPASFFDIPQRKSVLSPETNDELKFKIRDFEENRLFLTKGLTLAKLATDLGTNTHYLSTYINEEKEMHFNRYLAKLRIEFITHKMNTERKFLHYNFKALADECGITSRQSFSEFFFEINGIRPKDYIRKRKEELKANEKSTLK
ncbi:AraC family transcriptional regulator [Chryseobacterium koreense]|mgnify:CR=1 FL=1|uniref:helix-turn-helix domain-containing protein n=1 Tax=Chryseobacterium koreense TaxID=232216 RepID=UPI0026E9F759|nr:AraC family transcriptional regulator [Chryseobacterium koreense]